ncbi:hypothetical protein CAL26_10505 [Bordetella genomosp. 9]|uniref:Uncharacterized protein n=1 Tax=Bordetella genomosp. 9 TaxID=1416803 RepID=A0A261RFM1_9BORD|nr:TIR domain-containing protein [Bordetella genomosp. 9]OZI23838.1 hypothetical protein CAL26_10505 [Bordetella genomosp. 9]
MKVFISWSGAISHRVAVVLREWLPSVIQSVEPYVSSEDIDKGARWSTDIAGELHASAYGLICLTPENVAAPWINFEAGALGKSIDKGRVSPFLFRLKRSEVEGPILQFQSTVLERSDVFKLLESINDACGIEGLESSRLEKSFSVWWPQLEKQLNEIPEEERASDRLPEAAGEPPDAETSRVLEEILELTRNNHKLLRSPEALLPPEYIQHVVRRSSRREDLSVITRTFDGQVQEINPEAIRDLVERYRDVLKFLGMVKTDLDDHPACREVIRLIRIMDVPLRYIARELGLRLPREIISEKEEF